MIIQRCKILTITEKILAKLKQLSADDQKRILDTINDLPTTEKTDDGNPANRHEVPAKTTIWSKLQAIGLSSAETACDLPPDLAANHDFYLHRLPRRS